MRISDWSSDVCSSDLLGVPLDDWRGRSAGTPRRAFRPAWLFGHADSSIAVAPGLGPTEFTYFARLCDHADSHTTVAPGLGPGAHFHQRVARSCEACVLAGRAPPAADRPTTECSGVMGPRSKSRADPPWVPVVGNR